MFAAHSGNCWTPCWDFAAGVCCLSFLYIHICTWLLWLGERKLSFVPLHHHLDLSPQDVSPTDHTSRPRLPGPGTCCIITIDLTLPSPVRARTTGTGHLSGFRCRSGTYIVHQIQLSDRVFPHHLHPTCLPACLPARLVAHAQESSRSRSPTCIGLFICYL